MKKVITILLGLLLVAPFSIDSYSQDVFNNTVTLQNSTSRNVAVDASIEKLIGSIDLMVNKEFIYQTYVRNEGQTVISDYTVRIMDHYGTVFTSVKGTHNIPVGEAVLVNIPFIPTAVGTHFINAEVIVENDAVEGNNKTPGFHIYVQEGGTIFKSKVGRENKSSIYVPFSFYDKTSVSQSIYYRHEIGLSGYITQVTYFNNFASEDIQDKPIKIWMANIDYDKLDTWVPEDKFTLVYDGFINFPVGKNEIKIDLNTAFDYEGRNLVIMTERPMDTENYSHREYFYLSETPDYPNRTLYYNSDNQKFDWNKKGIGVDYHPNTELYMMFEGGSLSGVISVGSKPLEDVRVEIVDSPFYRITNEKGEYSFEFLPPGDYALKVFKSGYEIPAEETATVTVNNKSIIDFSLIPVETYTIKGKISADGTENNIYKAKVVLNGYDNYETLSDENGLFEFHNIYGGFTYELEVTKTEYEPYISSIEVVNSDINDLNIKLNEIIMPVWKVQANKYNDDVLITWRDLTNSISSTITNDDGTAEGGYSMSSGIEGWLGNIYKTEKSGLVTSVDIYGLAREGAVDRKVTVDIFDNSRNLIGSSDPFIIPAGDWINVPLPNVLYDGDFYVMVHWHAMSGETNILGYDQNGPHVLNEWDYMFIDGNWTNFHKTAQQSNCLFMIRVNSYDDAETTGMDGPEKQHAVAGYIIYRGLAADIENIDNWPRLNSELISSTSYLDQTWADLGSGNYVYAVKAFYGKNKYAEASLSNNIENSGPTDMSEKTAINIEIYPNPFKDKLYISNHLKVKKVIIHNLISGKKIEEIILRDKNTIITTNLSSGTYLIILEDIEGNRMINKMIKI